MAGALVLDGIWELTWFEAGTHCADDPAALARLDTPRVPARVPGNVELDLVAAGLLPDPFVGDNVHRLRALEACEWWYTRRFPTPPELTGRQLRLVFGGLDCLATVWLNGRLLGRTDNALVEHAFAVTGLLAAAGDNELVVRLASATEAARQYDYPPICHSPMATNVESLYIRKAPHVYGWDIAPRIVSAGIWRSVVLEAVEPAGIDAVYYHTRRLDGSQAVLGVHWRLRLPGPLVPGLSLHLRGACGPSSFAHTVPVRFVAGATDIPVAEARLWWPRGYGEAALYEVTCELRRDADGQVLARRVDTVGLRTAELVRTETTAADQPGQFLFRINGVPILCKGSNWVPADAFHSRDAERYARMLALCAELECNILRCWGGNVYEDDAFFSACDRLGILVWQDFAFACGLYPQDDAFLARVRAEAEKVVRRLRNHPCLVLWAGDNENDVFYLARGLDPNANRLTRQVLPEVCRQWDPYRPYLPSSPYVSPEVVRRADQRLMPEQHLWGPRDYFKSRYYLENTAHFASEIGYHGCPNVSSIERFIEPAHLWPWQGNEQWITHAADPVPGGSLYKYRIQLMADQIGELFGWAPDNLADFALASQISQAEAKKFFIELCRQRKWRTTGIIWWNLIDCWPQFSDAVVDYYFARKLAYWYIRRVQQPVCVVVAEPEDWHCRVIVGNDSRQPARGRCRLVDADSGQVLLDGPFAVDANANAVVGRLRVSRGAQRLWLIDWELESGQGAPVRGGNHYLAGTPPFSFAAYRRWLPQIAGLPLGFDAAQVAR